jgi:hypothetical protein
MRYCGMCDKWFKRLRTVECPECGFDTDKVTAEQIEELRGQLDAAILHDEAQSVKKGRS